MLFIFAFLSGCLLSIALVTNTQLGKHLDSPYAAGVVSTAVGGVLLLGLSQILGETWPGWNTVLLTPYNYWIGGLIGVAYLIISIYLIPKIGVVVTSGLQLAGQIITAVVLDHFGLFNLPVDSFDLAKLGGSSLIIFGVWLVSKALSTELQYNNASGNRILVSPYPAIALFSGTALPIQAAINAQLRSFLSAPLLAGSLSLIVGMTALILVILTVSNFRPVKITHIKPYWMWVGGVYAGVYVAASLILIAEIGAALAISFAITGQQVMSMLLDHFGWLHVNRRPLTSTRFFGVMLLLVGVIIIQFIQ